MQGRRSRPGGLFRPAPEAGRERPWVPMAQDGPRRPESPRRSRAEDAGRGAVGEDRPVAERTTVGPEDARSWLLVNGARTDLFDGALASRADQVVRPTQGLQNWPEVG